MIDPIIYTFHIFGREFPLRWYGVIVMIGVIAASLVIERELNRRGERGDRIWDVLVWVLPAGIVGARLWYVMNATLGGSRYYIDNPLQIINIPQGGLHIFGGFLFGAAVLLTYLRQNKRDPWIYLDAAAPAILIGPICRATCICARQAALNSRVSALSAPLRLIPITLSRGSGWGTCCWPWASWTPRTSSISKPRPSSRVIRTSMLRSKGARS